MSNERTLTNLRKMKGKIYIWFANKRVGDTFLKNAEEEGYRFGDILPTHFIEGGCGIVSLKKNKQLAHVGAVGHIEFGCNGGDGGHLVRIDYEKYIRGDKNFLFENPPFEPLTVKTKFFEEVTVIGDDAPQAAAYLLSKCFECETAEDEENLHDETGRKFKVIVLADDDEDMD